MPALAVIDMQRWMFRLPERSIQLGTLVPLINKLAAGFVRTDHQQGGLAPRLIVNSSRFAHRSSLAMRLEVSHRLPPIFCTSA
jgi:hypothetical protein